MKTFLWVIIAVFSLTGLIYFVQEHTETYEIKGICKKTLITYDHRSEHTDYTVIIQYEDGEVEDINLMDGKTYFTYKEGATYYFTRTRWVWNKTKKQ